MAPTDCGYPHPPRCHRTGAEITRSADVPHSTAIEVDVQVQLRMMAKVAADRPAQLAGGEQQHRSAMRFVLELDLKHLAQRRVVAVGP